jgi:hypothetical protein
MYTFESFEKLMDTNQAFAPLFGLGKIAVETAESVARRNYELAGDCFELGLGHLKALASGDLTKLPTEELRLATEFGEKVKAHADGYFRIAADASEAWSAWAASLTDTVKQTAAPKASARTTKRA